MLLMEHRTPQGLEIRMFGREAKRIFGVKVNKHDHDETEDELKLRFARVLRETNFAAIATVYAIAPDFPKQEKVTQIQRTTKQRGRAVMPPLTLTDETPIPKFLTEQKKG